MISASPVSGRILGWLGVVAIGVASLVPRDYRPHTFSFVPSQVEHFVAYLMTAAALRLGYSASDEVALIAVGLPVYSAALEILQLWIPGRHAAVIDFAASSAGAMAGLLLVAIVRRSSGH